MLKSLSFVFFSSAISIRTQARVGTDFFIWQIYSHNDYMYTSAAWALDYDRMPLIGSSIDSSILTYLLQSTECISFVELMDPRTGPDNFNTVFYMHPYHYIVIFTLSLYCAAIRLKII